MPAPSFAKLDTIQGKVSGATATIMDDPILISGDDALNTSIYTIVTSNLVGTFIQDEILLVNGIETQNTLEVLPAIGCIGLDTSTL